MSQPALDSMKDSAPPALAGAEAPSHAELAACTRLLAMSLAHHRAKFGVIPLSLAVEKLDDGATGGLAKAARLTLEEALELVRRRRVRGTAVPEHADKPFELDDKRRQLRISVNAAAHVADLDGADPRPAIMRNISWGGAAVRCDDMPGGVGARVCLLVPYGREGRIPIVATVLRQIVIDDVCEWGLRFDSLSPDDESRLQRVLEILVATPQEGSRRSEARLVQRLEIEYGDAGELRATLEDISASGLMLTVPEPLEINQSLLVSLSSADAPYALDLRARVVHQTLLEQHDYDMYRVGLEFEHPTPQLRERVTELLRELASLRPPAFP